MEERKKRDRRTFAKTHSKAMHQFINGQLFLFLFLLPSLQTTTEEKMEHKTRKYKTDRQAPHLSTKLTRSQTHRKVCFQTSRTYTFFRVSSTYYDSFPPFTHNKRPPRTATTKTTPLTMMISQEWTVRKYKCDQGKISDSFPTGSDSGSTKYRRRNSQFPVLTSVILW